MAKPHKRSLWDYLSKIKKAAAAATPNTHNLPSKTPSSTTSWIFRGCLHPKTFSDDRDHNNNNNNNGGPTESSDAATLEDIDRFLFENFKSLYLSNNEEEKPGGFLSESLDRPPDLCESHRFFVALSSTSSIMEEANTSEEDSGSTSSVTVAAYDSAAGVGDDDDADEGMDPGGGFIVVLANSRSPYDDFRRSMEEMVEARRSNRGKVDWEFMEELLSCYMDLNDRRSHKDILHAFVDLILVLRETSGDTPVKSPG